VETPPDSLIEAYLEEIARGYGVPYVPRLLMDDDEESGGSGGLKVRDFIPIVTKNGINYYLASWP